MAMLGLLTAPAATGATVTTRARAGHVVTTPIVVDGATVTATVTAPASQARLSFTVARATTVIATFVSWTFPADGQTSAYLTDSSGARVGGSVPLNGTGPWSAAPQLLAAGRYDVVVGTGSSGDSGSVAVQLTPAGSIALGGKGVSASIGKAGQPRLLAFRATAGETVAAGAAGGTFGLTTGATLAIENAAGVPQSPVRYVGGSRAAVYAAATLTRAGLYYVALRPAGPGSVGAATLTLRAATPAVAATIGGPAVRVAVTAPGLPATATFTGSAGETVGVLVHSATFSGYTARVYVTDGHGLPVGPEQYLDGGRTADGPVTLPAVGRYTVVVDPGETWSAGTVSLSLIKVTDVHVRAVIGGGPVTATVTEPTQQALVTFTATAHEKVAVAYSKNTFTSPADTIALDGPGGTVIDAAVALTGASGQLQAATLPTAGTYTVLIDPSFDGDTGSVSIAVSKATGSTAAARRGRSSSLPASPPSPPALSPPALSPPALSPPALSPPALSPPALSPPALSRPAAPHQAPAGARRPSAGADGTEPTFTVTYSYSETSIFYDGGPWPGGQGYDDTYSNTATWTQAPDGTVAGSASNSSTSRNWLYDDVCIISDTSNGAAAASHSGALTPDEIATSAQAGGPTSYSISPAPITATGTQTAASRDYDGGPCLSGASNSSSPWQPTVSLGEIQGSIPAGQTTSSGHSSCGSGTSVDTIIGVSVGITNCSLTWTVSSGGAVLGLGDSVTAGYGLGYSAGHFSGHGDNPSAYPAVLAKKLGLPYENYAVEGACASSAGGRYEEFDCQDRASLLTQIGEVPADFHPSLITVSIGADDIDFSTCIKDIMFYDKTRGKYADPDPGRTSPNDPCNQEKLNDAIARFNHNFGTALNQIMTRFPGAQVLVMDYYDPFPPPPKAGTDACELFSDATLANEYAKGGNDWKAAVSYYFHHHAGYLKKSAEIQQQVSDDATAILGQLNGAIDGDVASAAGNGLDATVIDTGNFDGHDVCAGDSWIFAPTGEVHLYLGGHDTFTYHFDAGRPVCVDPSTNELRGNPAPVEIGTKAFGITLEVRTNCMPHPTEVGQQQLAQDFLEQLTAARNSRD
jgi:lysophospholipase L1-like esterase